MKKVSEGKGLITIARNVFEKSSIEVEEARSKMAARERSFVSHDRPASNGKMVERTGEHGYSIKEFSASLNTFFLFSLVDLDRALSFVSFVRFVASVISHSHSRSDLSLVLDANQSQIETSNSFLF